MLKMAFFLVHEVGSFILKQIKTTFARQRPELERDLSNFPELSKVVEKQCCKGLIGHTAWTCRLHDLHPRHELVYQVISAGAERPRQFVDGARDNEVERYFRRPPLRWHFGEDILLIFRGLA